jgi:predicted transcriptional regulator
MSGTPSSALSNSAIAEYAERVGSHHGIYNDDGRADVKRLVDLLGGRVEVAPEMFAPEALTVHQPGTFTVHLPPITSDRRDRFTIAHELGHYFLHYLMPAQTSSMTFGRGSQNRAETEANFFGASLLMPAQPFRDAYNRYGADWWQIGDVFGVSPAAASVRAQVLGLDG